MNLSNFYTYTATAGRNYQKASLVLLPCIGGLLVPIASASAQVTAADDGVGTVIDTVGDRIDISGGQTSADNTNLFQSFEQFDLDIEQTANFIAAPDITNVVGRISGHQSSAINGTLQVSGSDANLYLMNPAGVLIGPDAQLNLSGGFTATTATDIDLTNESFEFATDRPGAIINFADLEVERGESINLVGGTVVNAGSLTAPEGSITVAAVEGDSVVRISQGDQLLSLEVDTGEAASSTITAESIGEMLTGEGLDHANTLVTHADGSVSLGHAETVIDETGGSAIATGSLSTEGAVGGNINVLGDRVSLIDAQLNASGETGGGFIRVGGDYQGNGPVFNAQHTTVDETTTLSVNALSYGDGGTAIVWADDVTTFSGRVEARGGQQSGNGGFAEISGANLLNFSGSANLSASQGNQGRVLLDPQNWVITDGVAPTNTGTTSFVSSNTIEGWTNASYELMASDSIRIEDLIDNELKLQTGVSLTLSAGIGSVLMEDTANDTIVAERGNVTISGSGLFLGGIDTSTNAHNPGGDSGITAGDVTLTSSQDVEVREIFARGNFPSTDNHSADGGNVIVTAANGNIDVANNIATSSRVNGRESGSAGDITLRTDNGNITVSAINPSNSALDAVAGATTYTSGNGGNISVAANNGGVLIGGYISSTSLAGQSDAYGNSNAGDGGNVTIEASGFISTDRISTISFARGNMPNMDGNRAGDGGNVTIESRESGIDIGLVRTVSSAEGDRSGTAGDVTLRAATEVSADSIDASSRANRLSGDGGSITVEAPDGVFIPGEIETYAYTREADSAGDAGTVDIESNNIQTGLIEAWSMATEDNSGIGGNVVLSDSGPGNNSTINITGGIQTFSRAGDDDATAGGSVTITADSVTLGMVSGTSINTTSTADRDAKDSGIVTVEAREDLTVSGRIQTFSEVDYEDAGNGGSVELSGNNISLGSIDTGSRANSDEKTAGNVSINSVQSLSLRGIDATSDAGDGNILLVGDRIEDFEDLGTLAGGTLTIDSATASGNINIGGTTTTTDFSLLESDLVLLSNIDNLVIGQIGSEGTITLQRSLLNSAGSRPSIMIQGGGLLKGPNGVNNVFQITGLGAGSLLNADVAFSNIASIDGGNQNDTFQFINDGAISTKIDGQAGYDTFDYSNSNNLPVRIDLANMTATSAGEFVSIENVIGSSSNNDTVVGTASDNTFLITDNNKGSVNGTLNFSGIENVEGGIASNTLDYSSYGSDTMVNLQTGNITGLSSFSGLSNVVGSSGSDRIIGRNSNNVLQIETGEPSSIDGVFFSNVETIEGGTGDNRLLADDINNNWLIDGANQGVLNESSPQEIRFENFQNLIGGSQDDIFRLDIAGSIDGSLIGGGGNSNELDYSQYDNSITINLEKLSTAGIPKFSGITAITGNSRHRNILLGTAGNDTFEITGERRGSVESSIGTVSFSNIGVLNGADGENIFNVESLTAASEIDIVGGSDLDNSQSNNRIIAAANDALWYIGDKNRGTLSQTSGDRLVAFREIQHLENTATGGEVTVQFTGPSSQVTGSIDGGDSDLLLVGDDITIGHGTSNASGRDNQNGKILGQRTLTIRPSSNSAAITLGGGDNGEPNVLNITTGELAAIQAGFESITIGGITQTGEITLGGDASFSSDVELRSQGNINTTGGDLASNNNSLQIVSQREVTTGTISNTGGSISISAQQNVNSGSIETAGGNLDITSATGSITTADITTTATTGDAGRVALTSPGSIEIEFIDASGDHSSTTNPAVSINTRESFTASGTTGPDSASITTMGTNAGSAGGSIQILYGEEGAPAPNFTVSRAGGVTTNGDTVAAGSTSDNLRLADVSFINRGIQPVPPEPETPEPVAPEPEIPVEEEPTLVFGQIELSIAAEPFDLTNDKKDDLFAQLETAIGSEFGQYLNLSDDDTQPATLVGAQQTLEDVEHKTDINPALLYVYFVPDAGSEAAVAARGDRTPQANDQLEVMLITQQGESIRQRQWGITREQVEETAQELRTQTTNQFSTRKQYMAPAQQMYDWIVRPVADELQSQNIDSIGFVLDTGLRTLPLAAIHDGNHHLVEDYSVGLLPTFSLTNFEQNGVERIELQDSKVLAMGASRFEQQPDLPAVSAEIALLAEGLWQGKAFLNEDFVLNNLQTQLRENDYGVVHLATHANFESGDLSNSYIQLWNDQLALNEINSLNLSEAEVRLIVLSACRTALGDEASEYGFAGFAVNTGVPSALASLWSVSDEGTLGFMTQFYDHLREAPTRSEALRQAQLDLINGEVGITDGVVYGPDNDTIAELPSLAVSGRWDFSHPFYWSAFTMIGNPW